MVLNVPMNYLYTKYKSQATRYAERGLRKALVRKLQQLSISYHKETQSGRLQSKIMRDVEAVETLSTQMFLGLLNIALNVGAALIITITRSMTVFMFFLFTTPVAAITLVSFRSIMKKRNSEFRREMEESSQVGKDSVLQSLGHYIRNPKVIVLDEATSALDSISEKLIQEALGNLTKGRTTFIVAHRLSTIRDADKIAVIDAGKCIEYGTFEELMELKGEFYKMKVIQS